MGSIFPGPVPPFNNPPIHPEWYQPRRFVISNISYGQTTIVTTSVDHDYVIGQEIRILIPKSYGAFQINNMKGFVISIPSATQVEVDFVSSGTNTFLSNPFTATITGATQDDPCVLTATSNFNFTSGKYLTISGVTGMGELNGGIFLILSADATTITIQVDAIDYAAYISGGTATLLNYLTDQPQIIAIGDVNSGVVNTQGRINNTTYVPGSFIDISPN